LVLYSIIFLVIGSLGLNNKNLILKVLTEQALLTRAANTKQMNVFVAVTVAKYGVYIPRSSGSFFV